MLRINEELNGIEISFDEKPSQETIGALKAAGYRWHRTKKLWYAKQTESRLALAKNLTKEAPTVSKVANAINLDNLGENTPRLYGTELATAIRADLKKRGVNGVSVRARKVTHDTGITVTVKATDADIVSIEEYQKRYDFGRYSAQAESYHGVFDGERWIYSATWADMTDEERRAAYNNSTIYYLKKDPDFNKYYHERNEMPTITTAFYNKVVAIYQIANQWNYDNSDSMTDYFDIGYFLDIDIKIPDDFIPRETMTDDEITSYNAEIEAEKAKRAAELAKYEQERKEAEEAAKRRAEQEKKDRATIDNNITIEDIEPLYISNLLGGIGKECNLKELTETIAESPHHSDAVITRRISFKDRATFEIFGEYLLADWDFCNGKGGTATDDVRLDGIKNLYTLNTEQRESVKWYMCDCIGVYVEDELQMVINPEGYSYPRYCYIPSETTTTTDATTETEKQRTHSESLPPFYFPETVEKQAEKLHEGQQITVYQCDGWNLANVYGGFGTITAIDPGTYAQYKGVYITLRQGKTTKQVFIRDNKKCLIYEGIKPLLPDNIYSESISENMSRIYNADELYPRILDYYGKQGETPLIDTIQR